MRIHFNSIRTASRLTKEFHKYFPYLSLHHAKDSFAVLCGYRRHSELASVLKQSDGSDKEARPTWTLEYIRQRMNGNIDNLDIYLLQAFCCKFLSSSDSRIFPEGLINDIRQHRSGIVIFNGPTGTGTTTLLMHAAQAYKQLGVRLKFIGYAETSSTPLSCTDYSIWEHAEIPYQSPVIIDPLTSKITEFDMDGLDFENVLYLSCSKSLDQIELFFKQSGLNYGATVYNIEGLHARQYSRSRLRFNPVEKDLTPKYYRQYGDLGRQALSMVAAFSGTDIIVSGHTLSKLDERAEAVQAIVARKDVDIHKMHASSLSAAYGKFIENTTPAGDVLVLHTDNKMDEGKFGKPTFVANSSSQDALESHNEALEFIRNAYSKKVSNIHVFVRGDTAEIKFRINGELKHVRQEHSEWGQKICQAVLLMSNTTEVRLKAEYQSFYISSNYMPLPQGIETIFVQFNPLPGGGRHMVCSLQGDVRPHDSIVTIPLGTKSIFSSISWLGLEPSEETNARRLLMAIQAHTRKRQPFVTAVSFRDITIKDLVEAGYKEHGKSGIFTHQTTELFTKLLSWFEVNPTHRAI